MDKQARQLVGLIEDMVYHFGTHNMSNNCCENISHGEFRALRVISRLERCTMQDIAKNIAVTKSGATRIVSRLEEKKLARRISDQDDGRVCCVQLSKEGKHLLARLTEEPTQRVSHTLSAMEPSMRQILLIGLNAFFEAAQNETAKGTKKKGSAKNYKIK
jgi:DNA-binding MarR family transcriptional regulator